MPRGRLLSWGLVAWLVRGAETDSMSDQSLCFQGRGDPLRTGRGDSGLLSLLGPWPGARASPFSRTESPGGRGPKWGEAPGGPRWEANLHPQSGDPVGARRVHVRVSESQGKGGGGGEREARGERGGENSEGCFNNFAVASAGAGISGFRAGSGLSNYAGLCRDMQEARCRLF